MTIYVTYEPHKGNVWGCAIMDQNMTFVEVRAAIERIKTEAAELGITATFQTANEIMGNFLTSVKEARKEVA